MLAWTQGRIKGGDEGVLLEVFVMSIYQGIGGILVNLFFFVKGRIIDIDMLGFYANSLKLSAFQVLISCCYFFVVFGETLLLFF